MVLEIESKAPPDLSEPEPEPPLSMYGGGPWYLDKGQTEEIGSTVCSAAAGSKYLNLKQAENERSDVTFWDWCKPDADLLEKIWLAGRPWRLSEDETQESRSTLWESEEIGYLRSLFALSDEGSSSEEETDEILVRSYGREKIQSLSIALWSNLHPDVLEKVIARLPSPRSLVRASTISKEWGLRFYSASFRHEVNCCSADLWSSYCPWLVTGDMKELVGFASSSGRWCRLPTLSYLPNLVSNTRCELVDACGSLLCFAYEWPLTPLIVMNPLTRTFRLLPPCPDRFHPHSRREQVHIVCDGESKTYKVIISSGFDRDHLISIFDYPDCSWTSTQFSTGSPQYDSHCSSTVMNGVLHKLFGPVDYAGPHGGIYECYGINSLDLNEKVWKGVSCLYQIFPENPKYPPRPLVFQIGLCKIFMCESKVILVATQGSTIIYSYCLQDVKTLSVFELDLDNGWAVEVSRAPTYLLGRIPFVRDAVCHGECIYIGDTFPSMLYNVTTREWSSCDFGINEDEIISKYYHTVWPRAKLDIWRWVPITYQPGLNPWREV